MSITALIELTTSPMIKRPPIIPNDHQIEKNNQVNIKIQNSKGNNISLDVVLIFLQCSYEGMTVVNLKTSATLTKKYMMKSATSAM